MRRPHFPRIARLPRFVGAGLGFLLFQNVEDVIKSMVTFGTFMGLPASSLAWLTAANIAPYARPVIVLFVVGMVLWTVWPGGFHPLKWAADWLKEKRMATLTLGLGALLTASGLYLSYRGIADLVPRRAGAGAPASPDKLAGYGRLAPNKQGAPNESVAVGGRAEDARGTTIGPLPTSEALAALAAASANRVVIECHAGTLGKIKLPGRKRAYMLNLPSYQPQGVGFMEQFSLNEDGELDYSNVAGRGPAFATICEINNPTEHDFVNLQIEVKVKSWNAVRAEGNSTKIGDFAYDALGAAVVPHLPSKGKFTFYIWNVGPKYHEISFLPSAKATSTTSGLVEDVRVFTTQAVIATWPSPQSVEPSPPSQSGTGPETPQ